MFLLLALALIPQDPDPTIPTQALVVATASARGVQIYRCDPQPTGQTKAYKWVFQAPQATLLDSVNHQPVGTHSAGPTWLWQDGSSITGKVVATLTSPVPNSIPWLLLEAHQVVEGAHGMLTSVTLVRRSDTEGGLAPATGCDAPNAGALTRVPYTATYTFYRPADSQ